MTKDLSFNPAFIPAAAISTVLYDAGYRPRVEYHHVYYALISGGLGAEQNRTRRWFMPRNRLADLAKRLKLRAPVKAVTPAPSTYDSDLQEAAQSFVDGFCADRGYALPDQVRTDLIAKAAAYLEPMTDNGHRYWSSRTASALLSLIKTTVAAIGAEGIRTEQQEYPVRDPEEIATDESIFHAPRPLPLPNHGGIEGVK